MKKNEDGSCGDGCCCGTSPAGAYTKRMMYWVLTMAVLAAVAGFILRNHGGGVQTKGHGGVAVPGVAAGEAAKQAGGVETGVWGKPLNALTDLNDVASNSESVFVVLPSSDAVRTVAIQKEVLAAALALTVRESSKMGTFLLNPDSPEYAELTNEVGSPAVLVMCKGLGMAAVKGEDVTQAGLLKAFEGVSKPSGCGAGGCGAGGCGSAPEAMDDKPAGE